MEVLYNIGECVVIALAVWKFFDLIILNGIKQTSTDLKHNITLFCIFYYYAFTKNKRKTPSKKQLTDEMRACKTWQETMDERERNILVSRIKDSFNLKKNPKI